MKVGSFALVTVACVTLAGTVRAGDEAPPAPALVTRWIDVSALTFGASEFRPEQGPTAVASDQVNDEENPLFGGEGEEWWRPFGGPDELIDRVKTSVADPGAWEAEGTSLSHAGGRWIVVRNRPDVVAATETFLRSLEREALVTYEIDVACFAGEASSVGTEGLARAVERGALVPLAGARATAVGGQRVAGRVGSMTAYVQDEDVEVAEDAKIGDPIVGVAPDGLGFDARVTRGPERLRLDVAAWWSAQDLERARDTGETGTLSLPRADTCECGATAVYVDPGAWTVVHASGAGTQARVLAARVTPQRPPPTPGPAPSETAPTARGAPVLPARGAPAVRRYDVADLVARVACHRGPDVRVWPSNYTPPEPPELPESMSLFQDASGILEALKATVDPAGWEDEGVWIRAGTYYDLLVRTDAPRHAAVEAALAGFRRLAVRPARLRAVVATMPAASLPELWTGLSDTLVADGGAALLARAGAKVVDRATLRLMTPQRDAAVGGRWVDYVGDFDVEISCKSTIPNPIVKRVFAGLSLDVRATWSLDRDALLAEVRLDRSTLRAMRDAKTPVGTIECPSLGVLRARSSVVVPAGSTRLVAADLVGGEVTLVLLHAAPE